ncbi:PRD domain-containing protein [Salibacterium salarium]|uniref:PRD domain-containing protein n=1 Tax=Salibacterium salarium TaxID=284579 RepID=A0A428MZR8_9BACI|nr:PRD domain-containing protein [Salibacterium salarium]RSL31519.1 PRD domain-containing protein [Salibacterium salarium]
MLTEEMQERLSLLRDSSQIDKRTYDLVTSELNRLIEYEIIDLEHEQIGSFTNHLAIAAERINKQQPLESTTSEIEDVIHGNPVLYKESESVLEHCLYNEKAAGTRAEIGFVTLYLCMFTQS